MKTKNRYQQMLHTYLCRRDAIRANYTCWQRSKEYVQRTKYLKRRIDYCRQQIKRIEKRELLIKQYAQDVCDFLDIPLLYYSSYPLKNCIHKTEQNYKIARNVFYKYAMEKGIQGTFLSDWVGAKDRSTACRGRLRFTRSFKYSQMNRELWHRFKQFLQDEIKMAA